MKYEGKGVSLNGLVILSVCFFVDSVRRLFGISDQERPSLEFIGSLILHFGACKVCRSPKDELRNVTRKKDVCASHQTYKLLLLGAMFNVRSL